MKFFSILFCLFLSFYGYSQEVTKKSAFSPPVPVEFLFGNDHLSFQSMVSKPLSNDGKFGYTFIASIDSEYKTGDESTKNIDIMIPIALNYKIYNDIAVNGGVAFNNAFGNRPFLGFRYLKVKDNWVIVVIPSLYFSNSNYYETFASVEYQPRINSKIKLYTRLQGLYSFDIRNNDHDRSFFYGRLGLTNKKTSFGVGYNWDSYGPSQLNKNNAGVFVRTNIF